MELFQHNCEAVLNTLRNSQYPDGYINAHDQIYHSVAMHALNNGIENYSTSLGTSWSTTKDAAFLMHNIGISSPTAVLGRLEEVYMNGAVISVLPPGHRPELPKSFEDAAREYSTGSGFTKGYAVTVGGRCRRFLRFIFLHDVTSLPDITYPLLLEYADSAKNRLSTACARLELSSVRGFLHYLAAQDILSVEHAYAMEFATISKGSRLRVQTACEMTDLEANKSHFSLNDVRVCSGAILQTLEERHYSKTTLTDIRTALHLYGVHLDANALHHSEENATHFLEIMKPYLNSTSWIGYRRALCMLNDAISKEDMNFPAAYTFGSKGLDQLPEWMRTEVEAFLAMRKKAKIGASTLTTDETCCVRFCKFLVGKKIRSFSEITPQLIKEFNLTDKHATPEGKAACNTRVRYFLRYLQDKGMLGSHNLDLALPRTPARKEKLVITLSDEDRHTAREFIESAGTPLELRDAAIALLGIELGLRASDIVNLKFSDIDWKEHTMQIVQKKTGKEICLPFPVSVGNALFRYIRDGRPVSEKEYVFLSHRAPFRHLGADECRQAISRILPERTTPGHGFHVTRKTFASEQFANGSSPEMIAAALGHNTSAALAPYLAFDEARMKECPLSLAELDLLMEVKAND